MRPRVAASQRAMLRATNRAAALGRTGEESSAGGRASASANDLTSPIERNAAGVRVRLRRSRDVSASACPAPPPRASSSTGQTSTIGSAYTEIISNFNKLHHFCIFKCNCHKNKKSVSCYRPHAHNWLCKQGLHASDRACMCLIGLACVIHGWPLPPVPTAASPPLALYRRIAECEQLSRTGCVSGSET